MTLPLGQIFGNFVNMANYYASSCSPWQDDYQYTKAGEDEHVTIFLDQMTTYDGDAENLDQNVKDCFDYYDNDLFLQTRIDYVAAAMVEEEYGSMLSMLGYESGEEVVAAGKKGELGSLQETFDSMYWPALYAAYDTMAVFVKEIACYEIVDANGLLDGSVDIGAVEDALADAIYEEVQENALAAADGQAYTVDIDKLLPDANTKVVAAMYVRYYMGNSFFAHPNAEGHVQIRDAALGVVNDPASETDQSLPTHLVESVHAIHQLLCGGAGHSYVDGVCGSCGAQDETVVTLAVPQIQFCYSQKQDSVRVQWDLVEGADGYQVYRSESPDGSTGWSCVKTVKDGMQNTYTNQGLTEGVTYYYKVRAYIQNTEDRTYSDFSEVKFMPAAVVWDAPYSNSDFRIRLRWQQVGSAHGYQIWRMDEDGEYRVVKTIGDRGNELTDDQGATTAYSNTGLTSGGKYTYKMRAFYITGDGGKVFGPFSDEITVSVQPKTPVVTVTSPKAGRAQIDWTMDSIADGYQVWMSESEDSGFAIAKSVTDGDTFSYTKYDLESGKTYYFKVRSYALVGDKMTFGAYSETVAVTVQ